MRLLLTVLFLLSTVLVSGDKLLDDFQEKAAKLKAGLDEYGATFSDAYQNHTIRLTEDEWSEAGIRYQYASYTFQSAVYAEVLCQLKKGEGYCMDADLDLVIVAKEVEALKPLELKASEDSL